MNNRPTKPGTYLFRFNGGVTLIQLTRVKDGVLLTNITAPVHGMPNWVRNISVDELPVEGTWEELPTGGWQ